jgi:hypothetical protein
VHLAVGVFGDLREDTAISLAGNFEKLLWNVFGVLSEKGKQSTLEKSRAFEIRNLDDSSTAGLATHFDATSY